MRNGARFMLVEITRYWFNRQNVSINSWCVIPDIDLQVLFWCVSHVLPVSEPNMCMKLKVCVILVRIFFSIKFPIYGKLNSPGFQVVILKHHHTRIDSITWRLRQNELETFHRQACSLLWNKVLIGRTNDDFTELKIPDLGTGTLGMVNG